MGFFSKPSPRPVAGFFGKIPVRGDFVAGALPREFQNRLETWIKTGLAVAQRDPDWHAAYMSSPIWQFAFAPAFLDDSAWCGVMMPSVDSVGRNFPLVIAMRDSDAGSDTMMSAQLLAQDALSQDFHDVDGWKNRICALNSDVPERGTERIHAPAAGAVFRVVDASGEVMSELRETNNAPELYSRLIGSTGRSGEEEASLL